MDIDREELARHLRALHGAMHSGCRTHEQSVGQFDHSLNEVYPAEGLDPDLEGSWGWWANRIADAMSGVKS